MPKVIRNYLRKTFPLKGALNVGNGFYFKGVGFAKQK